MRVIKANHLDLEQFQFDYDLTFAVVFMNADKTVYARYGSRSSLEEADREMTLAGLAQTMREVIRLHEGYPENRAQLQGKQPVATQYKRPGDLPSLQGKYKDSLDYDGAVSKSCLHCHQIRDAKRQVYRDAHQPIPDRLLFPYPMPDVIGLHLDASTKATVSRVSDGSPAASAGIQPGDQIRAFDGQPIASLADVQWVLHHTRPADALDVVVRRNGEDHRSVVPLQTGWRRNTDLAWRVSSWSLRRMGTGGILFEAASDAQRQQLALKKDQMALVAKHVGQYGAHAAAKRAGVRKGDVIVSFDGIDHHMTPSQLLAYAAQNTQPGDQVPVVIVRDGKRQTIRLPMQK